MQLSWSRLTALIVWLVGRAEDWSSSKLIMAAAMPKRPPRSLSRTMTVDHDQEQSTLLDRLMSMGFPQNRS